jgi:hypothetical protein
MSAQKFNPLHLERPRLPSIETQTLAFFEAARPLCRRRAVSMWLRWKGIEVFLRYSPSYIANNVTTGEVLVIANVNVPEQYQRRGWFWNYIRLCYLLAENGVVIECVDTDYLYQALSQRPEFVEFESGSFLLTKCEKLDWPGLIYKNSTREFNLSQLGSPRLPSVETQTLAFVDKAKAQGGNQINLLWLRWDGFKVCLRYLPQLIANDVEIGEVLVIASIESPVKYQQRGWFWYYLRMCYALVNDGLVIECVRNSYLHYALSQRPEFIEFETKSFLLKKDNKTNWLRLIHATHTA